MKGNFFYKRLGENLYTVRKRKKMSQEQLAFDTKVDRTYIARIEKGKVNPSVKILGKLSRGLRMKLTELVKGL